MRVNRRLHTLLFLPILLLIGCAAISLNRQVAEFQRPPEDVRFFELLDRTVVEADVRDASVFTVSGFPYLRTNRFLTGLKDDLTNDARKEQWVRRMQHLDLEARQKEIRNLPAEALKDLARLLGEPIGRQMLQERAAFYSEKLLTHDQRQPNFYEVLLASVTDPSEYSTAMRVVGDLSLDIDSGDVCDPQGAGKIQKVASYAPVDQLETLGELTAYVTSQDIGIFRSHSYALHFRSSQDKMRFSCRGPPLRISKHWLTIFAPVIISGCRCCL